MSWPYARKNSSSFFMSEVEKPYFWLSDRDNSRKTLERTTKQDM
jgi:hypothetical protein